MHMTYVMTITGHFLDVIHRAAYHDLGGDTGIAVHNKYELSTKFYTQF